MNELIRYAWERALLEFSVGFLLSNEMRDKQLIENDCRIHQLIE